MYSCFYCYYHIKNDVYVTLNWMTIILVTLLADIDQKIEENRLCILKKHNNVNSKLVSTW